MKHLLLLAILIGLSYNYSYEDENEKCSFCQEVGFGFTSVLVVQGNLYTREVQERLRKTYFKLCTKYESIENCSTGLDNLMEVTEVAISDSTLLCTCLGLCGDDRRPAIRKWIAKIGEIRSTDPNALSCVDCYANYQNPKEMEVFGTMLWHLRGFLLRMCGVSQECYITVLEFFEIFEDELTNIYTLCTLAGSCKPVAVESRASSL